MNSDMCLRSRVVIGGRSERKGKQGMKRRRDTESGLEEWERRKSKSRITVKRRKSIWAVYEQCILCCNALARYYGLMN